MIEPYRTLIYSRNIAFFEDEVEEFEDEDERGEERGLAVFALCCSYMFSISI